MTPQITFTDEFHMTDSSLSWENIIIEYGEPSLKNLCFRVGDPFPLWECSWLEKNLRFYGAHAKDLNKSCEDDQRNS